MISISFSSAKSSSASLQNLPSQVEHKGRLSKYLFRLHKSQIKKSYSDAISFLDNFFISLHHYESFGYLVLFFEDGLEHFIDLFESLGFLGIDITVQVFPKIIRDFLFQTFVVVFNPLGNYLATWITESVPKPFGEIAPLRNFYSKVVFYHIAQI